MSLWRLQGYGQRDWAVPQTCCVLTNRNELRSYLDPKPQNLTLCQSLLKHEYGRARYTDSCLEHLDDWYRQHYFLFLIASLVVAIVEFSVLLSIILSCTKMSARDRQKNHKNRRSTGTTMQTNVLAEELMAAAGKRRRPAPQPQVNLQHPAPTNENIYMTSAGSEHSITQRRDNNRNNYADPSKIPNAYPYQMSKSYLV